MSNTRYGKSMAAIQHSHATGSIILTYSQAEARRLYRMADMMGLRIRVEVVNPYVSGTRPQYLFTDEDVI